MLRPFRSPPLAWLALVGFLLAQPMVGCALLCLDNHHGHGEMVDTSASTGPDSCHSLIGPTVHQVEGQTVSFMAAAARPAPVRFTAVSVRVPTARPTTPARLSPGLDPPPPRLG